MEIQQETMGFDNGNSEEEAISNMTEDQCQQAISKLEYYTVKFEEYVEALRKLDFYRRESGGYGAISGLQCLLDYNLVDLCNENYFFYAPPERKLLSNVEILETLRIGITSNRPLHFEIYILFYCIASNYLVAMYEILYDRTDFRYSQAFLYKAVKKFKTNNYNDKVETMANKIHDAKQIFKEIWPRFEMDNFINLRKTPEEYVIKRPFAPSLTWTNKIAPSHNWTDKMYISEYRNVRIFHKLDGLQLDSKALFQLFSRISIIFAEEAAPRIFRRNAMNHVLFEDENRVLKRQRSFAEDDYGGAEVYSSNQDLALQGKLWEQEQKVDSKKGKQNCSR